MLLLQYLAQNATHNRNTWQMFWYFRGLGSIGTFLYETSASLSALVALPHADGDSLHTHMLLFEHGHLLVAAVETEWWWADSDDSDYPDAGKVMSYTIAVSNEGTVTLREVQVTGTGGILCDETMPLAVLEVGDSFHCTASRQVRDIGFI